MWIFRRHKHLKLELLSEYIDGRLDTAAQARVSRQVDSCEPCRQELDSLRSTVNLLQALPELTPPRSFTLAAPPAPRPVMVRQPLPLRAPGWAYAGAASLAGLALAIMVSADTLGLLTPSGQANFSTMSSDYSAQSLELAVAPEAGSAEAMATSEPQIASGEPSEFAPPEPDAAPEADSIQSFRAADSLPESPVAAPAMAQADATEQQPEPMAMAGESGPGADGATELADSPIEGTGFSDKTADPSEEEANLSNDGSTENDPGSNAVLTLEQYRGTPVIWRVLEGAATVMLLALLSILAIKRLLSRRIGG